MTKTRLFTISTLCVILFGVVGYGVYNYIRQYRENSYTDIEISPTSPYSFTQKEIVDGETFSLPFLPPETSLTLDIDIFQPKREIESSQGIDIEDLTIVELTFKNIKFLSLRIGIYSPTRDKVIQAGSLGI
ncbi:MAG: hypothetical protein LBD75_08135 [Candidatus Peribacteria bacterium]|jgi:hypothetical protein|nr:hypothetical protein [Candidatus Peribacteria bacterium]